MGACAGSFKVKTSVDFICGFSGKTKYAARRFVSSGFLRGESCGYVEVGMMISETASHFYHIKVTVGGRAELPLENTGLFGFYVCIRRLEFPSAEQERFPKPAARTLRSEEEHCWLKIDSSVCKCSYNFLCCVKPQCVLCR